jgi:hypothetical protein
MHGDSIQPRLRGLGAPSNRPSAGPSPTEPQLRERAAGLAPGRRRRVEESIWITVDGWGRLRFQVRMRVAGRGARQWARTVDTFEQAVALRERFEAARRGRGLAELRGQQLARMRFEQFVEEWWESHVQLHCNGVTQARLPADVELLAAALLPRLAAGGHRRGGGGGVPRLVRGPQGCRNGQAAAQAAGRRRGLRGGRRR